MDLTETEIQRFIDIAKKDYNITLSKEQALQQGYGLILLFETMLKKDIDIPNYSVLNEIRGQTNE